MTKLAHTVALGITGKIGDLVYQRVRKGKGNILTKGKHDLQVRRQVAIVDARSPAQLAGRARLAAATAAYKALPEDERATWKARAKRSNATGYNLFVADYCAKQPL